jgi:predicted GNAT family acetyltransferase
MLTRHHDATMFDRLVTPLLLRDEPRYNLELALTKRCADGEYEDPLLLTTGDPHDPDGAALMTAPQYNLLVAALPHDHATETAEYVAAQGIQPPGVMGAPETAQAIAARLATLTGVTPYDGHHQGVYALTTLIPPRPTTGALRQATQDDVPLIVEWDHAFQVEAGLVEREDTRSQERVDEAMVWLWEDGGEPVSMVGCGGFTPHGARVGPVYTPPGHRGHGYASAATAGVTRTLLDRGLRYTFLYTDLRNPTSNKIYRAIGYEHVTDVLEIRLAR